MPRVRTFQSSPERIPRFAPSTGASGTAAQIGQVFAQVLAEDNKRARSLRISQAELGFDTALAGLVQEADKREDPTGTSEWFSTQATALAIDHASAFSEDEDLNDGMLIEFSKRGLAKSISVSDNARRRVQAAAVGNLELSTDTFIADYAKAPNGVERDLSAESHMQRLVRAQGEGLIRNAEETFNNDIERAEEFHVLEVMKSDPTLALEMLDSGAETSHLDKDRISVLTRDAKNRESGLRVEQNRQLNAAQKEQYAGLVNNIWAPATADEFTSVADIRDSGLGGIANARLFQMQADVASGKIANAQDFNVTSWLFKRIIDTEHPDGHIDDPFLMQPYVGRAGLPWGIYQEFSKVVAEMKEGPDTAAFSRALNLISGDLDKDDFGNESALAQARNLEFAIKKRRQYVDGIAEGLTDEQMLNPADKKNYIFSDLDLYRTTFRDTFKERNRRFDSLNVDPDATLDETLQPGIGDNSDMFQIGETVDEWRERTGR